ncbi:MAG: A/G-specific adenine glycosylase, partial [Desulfohalobiaceae bacterium]|nr:A/G-specific adenine glycosylase [Desulfohalobiaceae bacterium]
MTTRSSVRSQLPARLLEWFRIHQRDLPWRREVSPYKVWISEIMLQQTQTKRVVHYFKRWMARFPDLASVARAKEDGLLKAWEGLGYYNRVRNIQRTALILLRDHGAGFPQSYDELLQLPGIGPYTAGAILSLAFNLPHCAVDGNVERVFARLFDLQTPVKSPDNRRFIREEALAMLPENRARQFNQALMELGAVVCRPRDADCQSCPVQAWCLSLRHHTVKQRPVPGKPEKMTPLEVAAGVLVRDGRILIQKRPPGGLMPHLWEFPGGKIKPGESPAEALIREFQEELELSITVGEKIIVIRHSYTVFRVTLHTFWCRLKDEEQQPKLCFAVDSRWVR